MLCTYSKNMNCHLDLRNATRIHASYTPSACALGSPAHTCQGTTWASSWFTSLQVLLTLMPPTLGVVTFLLLVSYGHRIQAGVLSGESGYCYSPSWQSSSTSPRPRPGMAAIACRSLSKASLQAHVCLPARNALPLPQSPKPFLPSGAQLHTLLSPGMLV